MEIMKILTSQWFWIILIILLAVIGAAAARKDAKKGEVKETKDEYLTSQKITAAQVAPPEGQPQKMTKTAIVITVIFVLLVLAVVLLLIFNPGADNKENLEDAFGSFSDGISGVSMTMWEDGFPQSLENPGEADTDKFAALEDFAACIRAEYKGTDNTVMYGAGADYYSVTVQFADGAKDCYFHISDDGEYIDYKGKIYKVNNSAEAMEHFMKAVTMPEAEQE